MISSQRQSLSKLFEETVLRQTFKDDPYFLKIKPNNVITSKADSANFSHYDYVYGNTDSYYNNYDNDLNPVTLKSHKIGHGDPISFLNSQNPEIYYTEQYKNNKDEPVLNGRDDTPWKMAWGWWYPRGEWLILKFFQQSHLHGLKFIAQPRRHLTERIFWVLAFLSAMVAAGYLINTLFERYNETPVIVTFDSHEKHIGSIPFPALTVCNMNKISVDIINRLTHRARKDDDGPLARHGRHGLGYAKGICENTKTFANIFDFASQRGSVKIIDGRDVSNRNRNWNQTSAKNQNPPERGKALLRFLLKETDPCEDMIIKCIWANKVIDCRKLFQPALTDYGKCCIFNRLPISLLLTDLIHSRANNSNTTSSSGSSSSSTTSNAKAQDIKDWKKWNYHKGFLLGHKVKYPKRQFRAGSDFGLSILLDPRADRYFCPSTDSKGFRIALNNPAEFAFDDVANFGIGIGLEEEVFIEVRPQLTLASPDIRRFDFKKRQCLFPDELKLDYYRPYSAKSCILECTSKIMFENCSCVPYNLQRTTSTRECSTAQRGNDVICVANTRKMINSDVRRFCPQCQRLCSELNYRYKLSSAKLQDNSKLWYDHGDKLRRPPDWSGHKMSVVHIYFGIQDFVPLLRCELFGMRDLIANTGNVLGLCLGFSVLSAFEIIFHLIIRPFWEYFRKKLFNDSKSKTNAAAPKNNRLLNGGWNKNKNNTNSQSEEDGKKCHFQNYSNNFFQNHDNNVKILRKRNPNQDRRSRNNNGVIQVKATSLTMMHESRV